MTLVKYNPFDIDNFTGSNSFQETMNRLFADANRPWAPPVDILETENDVVLKADLPDVKLEDIDIRLENGTLTLKGERKFENAGNGEGYHRLERGYGAFARVFSLPETLEADKVKADYAHGVLTVTLPKKEMAKPRTVKVEVSGK